jgi:hypothetical protein
MEVIRLIFDVMPGEEVIKRTCIKRVTVPSSTRA